MTASFAASSWTQLTLRLCCVEKEIGVIRLKADERVLKEEERVKMVANKQQELKEEHAKHVQERLSEYEHQLANITAMADREITELTEAKEQADIRIKTAEVCAAKAEANAKELEKEVTALYALYDKAVLEWESRLVSVRTTSDRQVDDKLQESNQLINRTSIYASEVQAGSLSAVAAMEAGIRAKVADLDSESYQRSRYQEIRDVAVSHSHREIPEAQFHAAKSSMIEDWSEQWHGDLGSSGPLASSSPMLKSSFTSFDPDSTGGPLARELSSEDILDKVMQRRYSGSSLSESLRSKDRALNRASEDQRSRQERLALRPMTAA